MKGLTLAHGTATRPASFPVVTIKQQPSPTFRGFRIALLGTRGIPARYGGFETFYENLAPRLVARGHTVTVYSRPHAAGHVRGRTYRGVTVIPIPSIRTKHLETLSHSSLSVLHALTRRYDIVLFCGAGNAAVAWVPRLWGTRVVLNVDGNDSTRAKWGGLAQTLLRISERLASRAADVVVADNESVRGRLAAECRTRAEFIPYGADLVPTPSTTALDKWGLSPRRYLLWVGRVEPESCVHEVIEAYSRVERPPWARLVIVGDAPFAQDYRTWVRENAPADVVFTGYAYGLDYLELSSHPLAFVTSTRNSGTSPALLEQMSLGNLCVVRDTATNREVLADAGMLYDDSDPVAALTEALRTMLVAGPHVAHQWGALARRRVASVYSWHSVVERYESLFSTLLVPRTPRP